MTTVVKAVVKLPLISALEQIPGRGPVWQAARWEYQCRVYTVRAPFSSGRHCFKLSSVSPHMMPSARVYCYWVVIRRSGS